MPSLATLLIYLMAGTALGLLTLRTGIPAAPLAGALLGAGLVSMSGRLDVAEWPSGTRTAIEIAIGTVIGTGLTKSSLGELQSLWKPALLITLTLVLTGIVIGLWSSRLLGIDPRRCPRRHQWHESGRCGIRRRCCSGHPACCEINHRTFGTTPSGEAIGPIRTH